MKMNRPKQVAAALAILLGTVSVPAAVAEELPAQLPPPESTPPATDKPIKVYILAGQSNMVGMGDISGARNRYAGIFLTANPDAPLGPIYLGRSLYNIEACSVYSPDGTRVHEPVAEGLVEVPMSGSYRFHCGSGDRANRVMELDGKEIYREAEGEKAAMQEVRLEAGRRHAFRISASNGETPAFWIEKVDLVGHGDGEGLHGRGPVDREGVAHWMGRPAVMPPST